MMAHRMLAGATNAATLRLYGGRRAHVRHLRHASPSSLSAPHPPNNSSNNTTNADLDAVYRVLLDATDPQTQVRVTPEQAAAVQSAIDGYSVFLHLPTGAGKSLAFQAPALAAAPTKTTLVVSPLIALMHDQVSALRRKGVAAVQVSSETRKQRKPQPLALELANQRLVYTTPEFLLQNAAMQQWTREAIQNDCIARIVLDEAHCVIEWGQSFRPAYVELAHWHARFCASLPLTLATASITDDEIAQLASLFHLEMIASSSALQSLPSGDAAKHLVVVQHVTDRLNLQIDVVRKPQATAASAKAIRKRVQQAPTIVYCLTRREAEEICLALVRVGAAAGVYHGGLARKRREFVRKQWMGGHLTIMCATSAFGMGIDRSDVRFVVHHSLPLSLGAYLQQIGRAGRDGASATCILLFDERDKTRASVVTTERDDSDSDAAFSGVRSASSRSYAALEDVASFCSASGCRKELLFSHFGYAFEATTCLRRCNCGPLVEIEIETPASSLDDGDDDANKDDDETLERRAYGAKRFTRRRFEGSDASVVVPKMQIEYLYQRALSETKRQGLTKRDALSRRVVQDILERMPSTEDEMAALRGVGPDRAHRLFALFASATRRP